jgi:hypothetical protein
MLTEETLFCQPSWVMQSNAVRMAVTQVAGHMAPVHFGLDAAAAVQPFHISPWQCEETDYLNGRSEKCLRGDFFCLPFGKADPEDGTPGHGRTPSAPWTLGGHRSDGGVQSLSIHMENALHEARVSREYFLRDGENIVYDRTTVAGLDGSYTMGHHAVLRVPAREPALLVSTSRQVFGMTFPAPFGDPGEAEYQSLAVAAEFSDLSAVPSFFKGVPDQDCSRYPARKGFSDLVQIAVEAEKGRPAWSAAVNSEEGYLWFSLRDPALLPSTILWIENAGRHKAPWNGRNSSLGIEDVCAYFDTGSTSSRKENPFSKRGIQTVHAFKKDRPESVSYLQGGLRTPEGFTHVRSVRCEDGRITLADGAGKEVSCAARTGFVFGEKL